MPRNKSFIEKKTVSQNEIVKAPNVEIPPNRIRIIRLINNMDIKELAKILEISQSMLQQIETQQKPLSTKTLLAISEYFKVSTDYILYKSDEPSYSNSNDTITNLDELKKYYRKEVE